MSNKVREAIERAKQSSAGVAVGGALEAIAEQLDTIGKGVNTLHEINFDRIKKTAEIVEGLRKQCDRYSDMEDDLEDAMDVIGKTFRKFRSQLDTLAGSPDLLPCPFCGAAAYVSDSEFVHEVRCTKCGATASGDDEVDDDHALAEKKAIAKWNARHKEGS